MELIKQLNWRYATKKMNGAKIPKEKLDRILEAISLSASSFGLQPYTILVIENEAIRKELLPMAYNQSQITDASQLLVFTAWENITEEKVTEFINHVASVRGILAESLDVYKNTILGTAKTRTDDVNFNWSARQAYIALGTGLAAAAMEEVDATPMEGFNPQEFDRILNLKEKGLKSLALLALGYRDAEKDPLWKAKKVRREKEKLFLSI